MKKNKQQKQETDEEEFDENRTDLNDTPCVDCGRRYPLIAGSSNIRCKKDNTLYKHNQQVKFQARAKKV